MTESKKYSRVREHIRITGKKEKSSGAPCAFCRGSGRDPNSFIEIRPCPVCKGKGRI